MMQSARNRSLVLAVVLGASGLALFLILACAALTFMSWIAELNPPNPAVTFEDLFPPTIGLDYPWSAHGESPSSPCHASPLGSGCRSIQALSLSYLYMEYPGGAATIRIYWYPSRNAAGGDYGRMEDRQFGRNSFQTPWMVPPELTTLKPQANRYRVGCDSWGQDDYCRFIGQYDEYIVTYVARMGTQVPGGYAQLMDFEELRTSLQYVDGYVTDRLGVRRSK